MDEVHKLLDELKTNFTEDLDTLKAKFSEASAPDASWEAVKAALTSNGWTAPATDTATEDSVSGAEVTSSS